MKIKVIVVNPPTEEQKEQIYRNIEEYYKRQGSESNA